MRPKLQPRHHVLTYILVRSEEATRNLKAQPPAIIIYLTGLTLSNKSAFWKDGRFPKTAFFKTNAFRMKHPSSSSILFAHAPMAEFPSIRPTLFWIVKKSGWLTRRHFLAARGGCSEIRSLFSFQFSFLHQSLRFSPKPRTYWTTTTTTTPADSQCWHQRHDHDGRPDATGGHRPTRVECVALRRLDFLRHGPRPTATETTTTRRPGQQQPQ
jgi:hypothetical protein